MIVRQVLSRQNILRTGTFQQELQFLPTALLTELFGDFKNVKKNLFPAYSKSLRCLIIQALLPFVPILI